MDDADCRSALRSRIPAPAIGLCLLAAAAFSGFRAGAAETPPGVRFSGSVVAVAPVDRTQGRQPYVVRTALTAAERAAPLDFEVVLRMRGLDEFRARVHRGERIAAAELQGSYLPAAADYTKMAQWLRSQGLAVTRLEPSRIAIFGRGSVGAVEAAFQSGFARVAAGGGEFTSAIVPPALPPDLAPLVLGVHGLQPQIRMHRFLSVRPLPPAFTPRFAVPYFPSQIAQIYGAGSLNQTGSGQTIAIYSGGYPADADLETFWYNSGASASIQNIAFVNVGSGPTSPVDPEAVFEASLDVEWASALAPSAAIRVYGVDLNSSLGLDQAYLQVYGDLPTQPGLHQFSISYGYAETDLPRDYLIILAQYSAMLANAGVTIFAAAGDSGDELGGVVGVSAPASDPSVTGVGGTFLTLNADYSFQSEVAWSSGGGGVSSAFPRPAWQSAAGLAPAGPGAPGGRQVPDVAAVANGPGGADVSYDGSQVEAYGTSWATPVWAAFCALINQARSDSGQPPVGLLNPALYSLIGNPALRDITAGQAGSRPAGVGYDQATGVGVPNVAALIQALGNPPTSPTIVAQFNDQPSSASPGGPSLRFVTPGQCTSFIVAVQGAAPLTYQWQCQAGGSGAWQNLTDNGTYAGSATPTLLVNGATYALNGNSYQCVVANAAGTATSVPASLLVNPYGVSTVAGWPGLAGSADGLGRAARFNFPGSIRMDTAGNLFVADAGNDTVRKIAPGGLVTTVAGIAGQPGRADGPVATALFSNPAGLALDPAGNIYVADSGNYTVRKISAGGQVTTLAGVAGKRGSVDGTGTAAKFYDPQNIAIGPDGTLYVADGEGATVRKVTPAGVVTTLAGQAGSPGDADGNGAAAQFQLLIGVAVDASGNVYVADAGNNAVRKISPAGQVTTLAIIGQPFLDPGGVAVDGAGNVYVADSGNNQIREISASGQASVLAGVTAGGSTDGPALALALRGGQSLNPGQFYLPADLWVDPTGSIYVADAQNNTIRRIIVGPAAPPQAIPAASTEEVEAGTAASLMASPTGSAPLTYQWSLSPSGTPLAEGPVYSGTTTATLQFQADVSLNGAVYVCAISNNEGTVEQTFALHVYTVPVATGRAQPVLAAAGGSVWLIPPVTAAATYQWLFNGQPLGSAATTAGLLLTNVQAANLGDYSVVASNSYGSTTVDVAQLSLASAQLLNLSVLAESGGGANALTVGFAVRGTGLKDILVRGIGPGLVPFGVADPLPQTFLNLYDASGNLEAENSQWNLASTFSPFGPIASVFSQLGAFPLQPNSGDSALLQALQPVNYSAVLSGGQTASLTGLAELYDADPGPESSRLVNISARAAISPGNGLSAGFVVGGAGTEKILIRGIGPALTAFGVPGALANPVLTLYDAKSNVIAVDAGWGNPPLAGSSSAAASAAAATAATFAGVGAFALPAGSADCAMVVTVRPGSYSAAVAGASATSGIGLVEIYELPSP